MTMTTTSTDVTTIPRIGHDEAMRITAVEFDRMTALFRQLDGDDWTRPTDNDQWDVRATALHLLGAAEANASLRESVRQFAPGQEAVQADRRPPLGRRHQRDPDPRPRRRRPTTRSPTGTRRPRPAAVKVRSRIPAPIRKPARHRHR